MSDRLGMFAVAGAMLLLVQTLIQAQTPLTNGARQEADLTVAGETDAWSFSVSAGDGLMIRVGATNFTPRIRLFGPDNALLAEQSSTSGGVRDVVLTHAATVTGNVSVVIGAAFAGQSGTYAISLTKAPGVLQISPGDQGGAMQNGAAHSGSIALGDLDAWTFDAGIGGGLMLRMGGTDLTPWIRLYGPNGALVAEETSSSGGVRDVSLSYVSTNAGTYMAVVGSRFAGQIGPYSLHLAQSPGAIVVSPGDEGGPMTNGMAHTGTITLGDLDVWSFSASAGTGLMLRMGGPNLTPWIRVYGPDGKLVAEETSSSGGVRDVSLTHQVVTAGSYTVVASAAFAGQVGPYTLHLAHSPGAIFVSPGDEGGPMTNGLTHAGTIVLGDLDVWSFAASAGDGLMLRMGGPNLTPWIRLYGPDGALVADETSVSGGVRDVSLIHRAVTAGAYTVVVSSRFSSQIGPYSLHLAQSPGAIVVSPGDEGGPMTNGVTHAGTIALGDLDMWSFEASAGTGLMLRMGGPDLTPWIRLYGPDGALVAEETSVSGGVRDVSLIHQAATAGTYTVVASSRFSGQVGPYTIILVKAPGAFVVPEDDQGGPLVNGMTNSASLTLGDMDVWSFVGTVGDSNVLRVTAVNFTPWIRLYGPTGAFIGEARSVSGGVRTANLIHEVTAANPGLYTVVVTAAFSGQNSDYTFKQSRWAPDLTVPEAVAIDEGSPLNVSISAQDPDEPNKPLQFKLVSGPPGATLTVAGSTNATISWPTTESDGPSTNVFAAAVTDVVNGRSFSRTNEFAVIVREINVAPQLTVPSNQTIDELTPLTLSASATDIDLPPNPLTFTLVAPPAGMTINPASGAIAWTPTEAQGPSVETITVVVTDSSPFAANAVALSTTNTFTVTVREINVPPTIAAIPNQTIDELAPLAVTATSNDSDLPANARTFALTSPPPGMAIDPASGVITWIPTESQGPSTHVITVVVTDSNPAAANEQNLSASTTFTVVVREVNSPPSLQTLVDQTIDELASLAVTASATDSDLPVNTLTYSLIGPPDGMTVDPASGLISWMPTEGQGPSTNIVSVKVEDNGSPASSVTKTLRVVVRELNSVPTLPIQTDRTIDELAVLTIANTATDTDLPANVLSYSLLSGPPNATVSSTGVITWTPTEEQGGTTNAFTMVVTDDATPGAKATNSFTVVVREVNSAPELAAIADQSVRFGSLLTLAVSASDADAPMNTLTYTLTAPPAGMAIDATSGVISWTPQSAQVGSQVITVRVADNGSPNLSATTTFKVSVTGNEARLQIDRLASGLIQVTIDADVGVPYQLQKSGDLKQWETLLEFRLTTTPFRHIDVGADVNPLRFYRLRTGP